MFSAAKLRQFSDYSVALQGAGDYEEVARLTIDVLANLIPSDIQTIRIATGRLPIGGHLRSTAADELLKHSEAGFTHRHDDPSYQRRLRLLLNRPASVHEFVSESDFSRTALYNENWRPMRIKRSLGWLCTHRLCTGTYLMRHSGADFSKQDSQVLEMIMQHVESSLERIVCASGDRLEVAGVRYVVPRQSWIVCNLDGKILRGTSEARRILSTFGLVIDERVPADWVKRYYARIRGEPSKPLTFENASAQVDAYVSPIHGVPEEFSVTFIELRLPGHNARAMQQFGITPREATVVQGLIDGKSNDDIAIDLGMSPLTVKKHIENLLPKLNASNRAAAAVNAMRAIQKANGRLNEIHTSTDA